MDGCEYSLVRWNGGDEVTTFAGNEMIFDCKSTYSYDGSEQYPRKYIENSSGDGGWLYFHITDAGVAVFPEQTNPLDEEGEPIPMFNFYLPELDLTNGWMANILSGNFSLDAYVDIKVKIFGSYWNHEWDSWWE